MKLGKFDPAREDFAPLDDNPELIFEIEALPGVAIIRYNKRVDAGQPVDAARSVLVAGIKSISGLTGPDGKDITTAAKFLFALNSSDIEAAVIAELVLLKIITKSQVTEETAKN